MTRTMKIWLILATVLFVTGIGLVLGVLAMQDWEIMSLNSFKYETVNHHIQEDFHSISIDTDTADLSFVPSEDGKCKITCYENEKIKHTVSVQHGVLNIRAKDERQWHELVGVDLAKAKIILSLPEKTYRSLTVRESTGDIEISEEFSFEALDLRLSTGDVQCKASVSGSAQIEASTGDIHLLGISAGELTLSVTTGKITLNNVDCEGDLKLKVTSGKTKLSSVSCADFLSEGNTGALYMEDLIAEGKLTAKRSTGSVTMEHCDAAELDITTDTGSVTGTLLTDKIFLTETDTGDIQVPQSTTGGLCRIRTTTGDITLSIS